MGASCFVSASLDLTRPRLKSVESRADDLDGCRVGDAVVRGLTSGGATTTGRGFETFGAGLRPVCSLSGFALVSEDEDES